MKFTRKASANWKGPGKDGQGIITTESKVLDKTQYSYKTRFENGKGTNPEELIAAAHSGCFTMQLSFLLEQANHSPNNLETEARVTFEDGNITLIDLEVTGEVEGIDDDEFRKIAEKAKNICPVSKVLNASINLNASLKELNY